MEKNDNKPITVDIPESVQEDAKHLIESAFRLFTEHAEDMNDGLAEFDRKREETRRRIQSGAKRTSGRIV